MSDVTVSQGVAKFFFEQCGGMYSGHMAGIPNNPVLFGLMEAHAVRDERDFARFLRQVANQLEKDTPF